MPEGTVVVITGESAGVGRAEAWRNCGGGVETLVRRLAPHERGATQMRLAMLA
jgi:hypothetical protein